MTPDAYRYALAERLIAARGDRSVHSCDESGIGYRVIRRLEGAGNQTVRLGTLYMLADYYDVGLANLVEPKLSGLGSWPNDAPTWPSVDMSVRQRLRTRRMLASLGARLLSKRANHPQVVPSWVFRIESGDVAHLDVIRLYAVMEVLGGSVADLLPPPLRMREDDHHTDAGNNRPHTP
jgi:hypothetical protein